MASQATVLTDDSTLSKLDQWLFKFESLLTLLGGIVIFLLVFLAVTNILGRWIFNYPVDGYIDWVEQSMTFFAFLGIAFTQREGGHIRMDIIIGTLKGRSLWFAELVSTTLMFLLTLILIYGSFLHFKRAYTIGDTSFDINLPIWPSKLVVPIALSILALRLFLQMWGYFRALKTGESQPVAVPLVEDAATVAAREAAIVGAIKPDQNQDNAVDSNKP